MLMFGTMGFAFACGCAAAHYLLPGGLLYAAAGLMLALFALSIVLLRGDRRVSCAVICLFAAAGIARYALYTGNYFSAAEGLAGTGGRVTVRVEEYPYRDGDYARVPVKLVDDALPPLGIDVSDYSGTLPELRAGDLVEMELDFVDATVKYGESTDMYSSRGTHLRAYFISAGESRRDAGSVLYYPQDLRELLSAAIDAAFPEDVRAVMQALLLGNTEGVYDDERLDSALAVTGLSHVISVSGMHVAFLFTMISQLLGRRRAVFFGAPVIALFTLMVGCTPAAVRACVMQLFSMLALYRGSMPDGVHGLGAALLLLLGINPYSVASVSLQLSFAAVLGMEQASYRAYVRLGGRVKGVSPARRFAAASLSSTVGAIIYTTPIVAWYFGYVSLISPIANLLTLWAVSLAFNLGFAAAIVSAAVLPLGAVLAWAAAWPARLFVFAAELLAQAPYAAVYTADGTTVLWLAATYVFFIAALKLRGEGKLRFAAPAVCSAALLAAVLISARAESARESSFSVLDVGQGQSIALICGENAAIIDCGGKNSLDNAGDTAADFLLSRGRRGIDALVLTHLHDDHANGVLRLMYRVDVGGLYYPDNAEDADGDLAVILAAAEELGVEAHPVSEDGALNFGGLSLELYAPAEDSRDNERGLIIRAGLPGLDAVITGDAGAATERDYVERGVLDDADVLVAGHHGSRYSNSIEMAGAAEPETVIVSVGYNTYGHPAEEALDRLAFKGARIFRTDLNGTVTIRTDQDG